MVKSPSDPFILYHLKERESDAMSMFSLGCNTANSEKK